MQKRIATAILVAAVALMGGCTKENADELAGIPEGAFLLTAEEPASDGTKTVANGTTVLWQGGETVNINDNNYTVQVANNKAYIVPGEGGTPEITGDKIYAFYGCTIDEQTPPRFKVTLPSQYECTVSGSSLIMPLPMAAYGNTADRHIQFKHLTAAISLTITNNTGTPLQLDEVMLSSATNRLSGVVYGSYGAGHYLDLTDFSITPGAVSSNGIGWVKVNFKQPNGNKVVIPNGSSQTVQVPVLPLSDATVNILVHANSNWIAHHTGSNIDADEYYGIVNVNYEYRYDYTPSATLTLSRNKMKSATVTINTSATSDGKVTEVDHGLFSVSSTKQVRFSKGNLRYQATASADNRWTFADYQYQYRGIYNQSIGESYNGYIDLFGWATSGYDNGQTYYQPWSYDNGAGYYNSNTWWSTNRTLDWGANIIYNNIYNNITWSTLTKGQWEYLIARADGQKWGNGTVAGFNGCIFLPDDWVQPYGVPTFCPQATICSDNVYTGDEWAVMARYGAVFLPAAGQRRNKYVYSMGTFGGYWTATFDTDGKAYILDKIGLNTPTLVSLDTYYGCSVRLVATVEN